MATGKHLPHTPMRLTAQLPQPLYLCAFITSTPGSTLNFQRLVWVHSAKLPAPFPAYLQLLTPNASLFSRVTAHDLLHMAMCERSRLQSCFQMSGPQSPPLCMLGSAWMSRPPSQSSGYFIVSGPLHRRACLLGRLSLGPFSRLLS